MPKRTNLLQEVMAVVYARLAGDAVTEDSAMLVNRLTGEKREVDVWTPSASTSRSVAAVAGLRPPQAMVASSSARWARRSGEPRDVRIKRAAKGRSSGLEA